MKNKIFSLVLALALTLPGVNAMAAETTEGKLLTTIIKPKDFASIVMSTASVHSSRKPPSAKDAYINTYRSTNVYYQYLSMITSFEIPLKDKIQSVVYRMYGHSSAGQSKSSQYIPLYYGLNDFPSTATADTYAEGTDEFTELYDYADNNWWSSVTYTKAANIYMSAAIEVDGYNWYFDVTDDFLSEFQSDETDIVTFATDNGHKNLNFKCNSKSEAYLPYLRLTFSERDIVEYINSATNEELPEIFEDFYKAGMFDATTDDKDVGSEAGYDAFTALDPTRQAEVCTTLAETDFATFDGFITVYDSLVNGDSTFTVYDVTITSGDTVYSDVASAVGQAVDVKAFTINEAPSGLVSILGAYDANGRLLTAEVANSNIEFSLTIPQGTSTIKLMCWDDIENRAPVCSALSK